MAPCVPPEQPTPNIHSLPARTRGLNNLLEPSETADILGTTVGVLAVWRTTKRYPLSWVKIGRKVMYKPDDVQAFINARTVSPVEV